jgi:hypothetical protein
VTCSVTQLLLRRFQEIRKETKIIILINTVKPGFYVPWIYIFLDSTHILISPTKTSVRAMLNFPGIYVCAFYPIPWLYIQTEHKLACCWCFKYFQLEIRKKKWFSFIISYLLYCLHVTILWLQGASRMQPCLPMPSLCRDEWRDSSLKFHAPSSTPLSSRCVGVASWIYCELN